MRSSLFHRAAPALAVGLTALTLVVGMAACTPRLDPRGNLPDPERLAEIKPGEQTRSEIAEILGSPSTIGNFDGEAWIYIAEKTETLAFFEPTVKERQIVILSFDDKGVVKSIDNLTEKDGKLLTPVGRETPTAGNRITLIQQLLGNIGRFTK